MSAEQPAPDPTSSGRAEPPLEDDGPGPGGLHGLAWVAGLAAVGCWIWLANLGDGRLSRDSTWVAVLAALVLLVGVAVTAAVLCGVKNAERRLRRHASADHAGGPVGGPSAGRADG